MDINKEAEQLLEDIKDEVWSHQGEEVDCIAVILKSFERISGKVWFDGAMMGVKLNSKIDPYPQGTKLDFKKYWKSLNK